MYINIFEMADLYDDDYSPYIEKYSAVGGAGMSGFAILGWIVLGIIVLIVILYFAGVYDSEYLGCFKDADARAIPVMAGRMTKAECSAAAIAAGSKIYGLQDAAASAVPGTAECWISPSGDAEYNKYGPSDSCMLYDKPMAHQLGKAGANAVYRVSM
jgi:hypothetical protein